MVNILLNRPATTNDYVSPFKASRAVDGNTAATQRWLGRTMPAWISVDAGQAFAANRWVVRLAQTAGWQAIYNASDFSLQASTDGTHWTPIDSVVGNTLAIVDRTVPVFTARYFKLTITKGPAINVNLASVVEFEVYNASTPNTLSALTLSNLVLQPVFNSGVLAYTSSVANSVTSTTVTPTATDPGAKITVNGTLVASGSGLPVNLNVGSNTVTVVVTPVSGTAQTYTIVITRADIVALSNLVLKNVAYTYTLSPAFQSQILDYASSAGVRSSVTVIPTALSPSSTIKVNGVSVNSGSPSSSIPLNTGSNLVTIELTNGGNTTTYKVTITK